MKQVVAVFVFALFTAGCSFNTEKHINTMSAGSDMKKSCVDTQASDVLKAEKTADEYIRAVFSDNRKEVIKLLSGEALMVTENNYPTSSTGKKYSVTDTKFKTVMTNEDKNLLVLDATVTFTARESFNQNSYRLYLTRGQSTWKIFKVEPVEIELPKQIFKFSLTNEMEKLIKNYINAAVSGRTDVDDDFLTGPALESQARFNQTYGKIKTGVGVSNLNLTSLGGNQEIFMVKAVYCLRKPSVDKPGILIKEKRSIIFQLLQVHGKWRIYRWFVEGVGNC